MIEHKLDRLKREIRDQSSLKRTFTKNNALNFYETEISQSLEDSVIGSSLTTYQWNCVQKAADTLSNHIDKDKEMLVSEIEFLILSSISFTHANKKFSKKLNVIKKYIKQKGLSKPIGMSGKRSDG